MKRVRMWNEQIRMYLDLDHNIPHIASKKAPQKYFARQYDVLIVGMDIWCVIKDTERPEFPSIYWLPEKISIPKIAYGISAINSDLSLTRRSAAQIGNNLNGFDVIGGAGSIYLPACPGLSQQIRRKPIGARSLHVQTDLPQRTLPPVLQ